jgi:protein involved in polysaccharide export with SLBB domain
MWGAGAFSVELLPHIGVGGAPTGTWHGSSKSLARFRFLVEELRVTLSTVGASQAATMINATTSLMPHPAGRRAARGRVPAPRAAFVGLIALALPISLPAQAPTDSQRAPVTRERLEAMATQAEQQAAAGTSAQLREQKRSEAAALRERLRDGDFQVGDRILLSSIDSSGKPLTDTLTVRAGRLVTVPMAGEVSLQGVLRSELQARLTKEIARYVKEPSIKVTPLTRVAVFGPVGRPGFYWVPTDILVSDAIMTAGGPGQGAALDRTVVRRGSKIVLSTAAVSNAIRVGTTLDQLGVRAGDEIVVGEKKPKNWVSILQTAGWVVSIALSVVWLTRYR